MRGAKWLVLWSLWLARLVRQPSVELAVSGGILRGSVSHDGSHVNYFAIPYATVNREHRFKAPGPAPTWEGVFEAINENVRCLQELGGVVFGQRNCLTVNVYTPISVPENPRPVMVFIHGGGFFQGSNSRFILGPNYLVNKGVVLVTINYRLYIQGYLCLGIKEAPGNAGMKDQVAALEWVKRNIRAFGGDPDNVTIFGESAGAASVSYHVLSPMSKGLFHKAILQSGSSLAAWAHQFRPVYTASLLAKTMGFNSQDPRELYNYLDNKTDEELILTHVPREEGNIMLSELLYVPCSEKVVEDVEPFLTELPHDVLSLGNFNKVPMIIGVNSEEGYFFASYENSTTLPKITIEKSLLKDLVFPTKEERKSAAEKIKNIYMGDDEIQSSLLKFYKFSGDLYFEYPAVVETEMILEKSDQKVYNYLLNYTSWRNVPKMALGYPFKSATGATHADDLFYLFQQPIIPTFFEMKMIARMTILWTNFAKYGDPTPETTELLPVKWVPTDKFSPQSFLIDSDFGTTPLWRSKNLRFSHELYTVYRRKS